MRWIWRGESLKGRSVLGFHMYKLNSSIIEVPIIKPSRLSDEELNFFAGSMIKKWKALGADYKIQDLRVDEYANHNGMLQSKIYKTKIRPGKYQYLTYIEDGVEKRMYLHKPPPGGKLAAKNTRLLEAEDYQDPEPPSRDMRNGDDWGSGHDRGSKQERQGLVLEHDDYSSRFQDQVDTTESSNKDLPFFSEDMEVKLHGREQATRSEVERDVFLLRLLEGRGSLRGPKYQDCAFIRRVWFPTHAQREVGENRKAKKAAQAPKGKHDWMTDDWDDDIDEVEVARIQALSLEEDQDDEGDQTEDDEMGMDDPRRGVELPEEILLNPSQARVVARMVAPTTGRTRATLVHGPPGTGKTSTIAAATWIWAGVDEPVWIVAQSNVGIRNVAEKLQKVGFKDFVLLVSKDYYVYWEDRYTGLKENFFPSSQLWQPNRQRRVFASKAVLCTLATLSSPLLEAFSIFINRPLRHLVIDEASQIDMTSEFMHLFYKHRTTLQSVCWFGDPKQLPPFGWSEGTEIQDIFQVDHLQANSRLLDTSCLCYSYSGECPVN
ncbi:hypothetical protein BDV93DRAFT_340806 [Ceratobasidium sp. AG-I]|nr:hypothetical protein BDV93DRAFT_340806 [Ceratobasidium sp. AG-I]